MTPPTPASAAAEASRRSSSGEVCATPGIASIGRRRPDPFRTNNGSTSCDGTRLVARTRRRSASVRRRRRPRYVGNDGMLLGLGRDELPCIAKLHQQARCTTRSQVRGESPARILGRGGIDWSGTAHDVTSANVAHEPVKDELPVDVRSSEGTDRHLTPALERVEKCPLRSHCNRRVLMVERRHYLCHLLIVSTNLDCNRTLSRSGEPRWSIEILLDPLLRVEANQA